MLRTTFRNQIARLALVALSLSIGLCLPASAQQTAALESLLNDSRGPRTLRELGDGTWKHIQVGLSGGDKKDEGGGIGGLFGAMFGGAMGGEMGSLMNTMVSGVAGPGENVYYTRGQTVALGPETFLIAYRVQTPGGGGGIAGLANLAKLSKSDKPPVPKPLTGEAPVGLILLNMRSIASLSDIRPFDLRAEIAASEASAKAMMDLINEKEKSGSEASPAAASGELGPGDPSSRNLKRLGSALAEYISDHDGTFPPMSDADAAKKALMPYVQKGDSSKASEADAVFAHPDTKSPYGVNALLSGRKMGEVEKYADFMVAFYETAPAADGTRGVVTIIGSIKRIPEAEWPNLKKASKIAP